MPQFSGPFRWVCPQRRCRTGARASLTILVFFQKRGLFQVGPSDSIHEMQVAQIQKDSDTERKWI